jgi:hypothetical protein
MKSRHPLICIIFRGDVLAEERMDDIKEEVIAIRSLGHDREASKAYKEGRALYQEPFRQTAQSGLIWPAMMSPVAVKKNTCMGQER